MSKKVYLKGIDALRGIAALLVIVGHVELLKKSIGYHNLSDGGGPFFLYLGALAVTFFFVLSGFLITYLLLLEKRNKGEIILKNFYLRRLLRIWPVYYILFISGFIILPLLYKYFNTYIAPTPIPEQSYAKSFIFNALLLPNYIKTSNPIAFQSWSIGVEEQFYIVWPLLFIYIKSLKKLIISMFLIVISVYILRSLYVFANILNFKTVFFSDLSMFFGESRFDNMAIGGLAGIYLYLKPKARVSLYVKWPVLLLVFYIIVFKTKIGYGLDNLIAAITFAFVLIILSTAKNVKILEFSGFKFLGKISYGLYMFHVIAIYLSLNIMKFVWPNFHGDGILNISLHLISIVITVVMSHFSFKYIEVYFLKFKK